MVSLIEHSPADYISHASGKRQMYNRSRSYRMYEQQRQKDEEESKTVQPRMAVETSQSPGGLQPHDRKCRYVIDFHGKCSFHLQIKIYIAHHAY